jgi:hypothetical protein
MKNPLTKVSKIRSVKSKNSLGKVDNPLGKMENPPSRNVKYTR